MLEYPEVRRRPFLLELEKVLREASEQSIAAGLLLVDITNLGRINKLYGHNIGDVALALAVDRLRSASTEANNVFRIASHQFAFILPSMGNTALVALAVNRLHAVLEDPIELGEAKFVLDISVGVATSGSSRKSATSLLAHAETSLQNAREGLDYEFVETEQDSMDRAHDRLRLEQDFVDTLNANTFTLYYQPKVNLKTGTVHSCEALLRWPQPDGGYLSPGIAIELAESLNLGYQLSKWILGEAARQAQRWKDRFAMRVAVNVEATLIDNPDLYNLVSDTLSIWSADKSLINIEVTESAVLNDRESSFENLRKLKEFGIGLSIDDFGTGYSSLSYFKDIPAQELKIDQSFIATLNTDPQNRALVDIIVDIAHLFDMTVVGEGVEDRDTLRALIASGSDYAQGFYFSRPLPPAQFETWLESWPGLDAF